MEFTDFREEYEEQYEGTEAPDTEELNDMFHQNQEEDA